MGNIFGSLSKKPKQTPTMVLQSASPPPLPRPTAAVYLPESPSGTEHLGTASNDADADSVGYSDGGSLFYEAVPGAGGGERRVVYLAADGDSTSETSSLYAQVTERGLLGAGAADPQLSGFVPAGRGNNTNRQKSSGADMYLGTDSSSDEDVGLYEAMDPETMSPAPSRSGDRMDGLTGRTDGAPFPVGTDSSSDEDVGLYEAMDPETMSPAPSRSGDRMDGLTGRTDGALSPGGGGGGYDVLKPRSSSALDPLAAVRSPGPQATVIGTRADDGDPGVFAESSSEDGEYEEIDHGQIGKPDRRIQSKARKVGNVENIILGPLLQNRVSPFSRFSAHPHPAHTPCDMLFLVPMRIGC